MLLKLLRAVACCAIKAAEGSCVLCCLLLRAVCACCGHCGGGGGVLSGGCASGVPASCVWRGPGGWHSCDAGAPLLACIVCVVGGGTPVMPA